MATLKSRVPTVNTRSSRLSFADLEAVTMNGKRSRAQFRTVPTTRSRARKRPGRDVRSTMSQGYC
jgi:uncharacterized protein with von Willebrand factor type A (vWA) domain